MKVLLADDSMTIRMILKNLLKELGITDVTQGKNGKEALELLKENKFDLVLIDIHMPKLDGLAVLEKIKNDPVSINRDVPVVIISSDTDYRQIERARELQAFGYIKKPFKKEALASALNAAQGAREKSEREETPEPPAAPKLKSTTLAEVPEVEQPSCLGNDDGEKTSSLMARVLKAVKK